MPGWFSSQKTKVRNYSQDDLQNFWAHFSFFDLYLVQLAKIELPLSLKFFYIELSTDWNQNLCVKLNFDLISTGNNSSLSTSTRRALSVYEPLRRPPQNNGTFDRSIEYIMKCRNNTLHWCRYVTLSKRSNFDFVWLSQQTWNRRLGGLVFPRHTTV